MTAVDAGIDYGPDNVGALVGSNIQLKCRFHHRSCKDMMWTSVGRSGIPSVLYTNGAMIRAHGGRYSVNVSVFGECTLHISQLELTDAGTFTCTEVIAGAEEEQVSKTASVTVVGM